MSIPAFPGARLALLPLALCCVSLPVKATAATDSAVQLLDHLVEACDAYNGNSSEYISDNNSNDPGNNFTPPLIGGIHDPTLLFTRTAASHATVTPTLCANLRAAMTELGEAGYNPLAAALTPDEIPALYTSLVQLSSNQIRNVTQHLRGRRQSEQTGETAIARNSMRSYYGGNAGDSVGSRFSLFVDGARVDGDQQQTRREVGYDLETDHLTVGVDYRISNELIAGFAYGNSDTTLRYSEANNQTRNDSDHYILYSSWYRDNFAVDLVLGHASGEFDTRRNLFGGNAIGRTDNRLTYVSIAGSYDFVSDGFTWGSFASFDYLDGEIDAFQERGDSGWEVAFAQQDVKSRIYTMGVHANQVFGFSWGVLIPHARVEWRTELENERDLIVGRFLQDVDSSFSLTADDPDRNWAQLSAGVSAQFPHGIAAFIDYEEVLKYADTDLRTLTLGVRWEL